MSTLCLIVTGYDWKRVTAQVTASGLVAVVGSTPPRRGPDRTERIAREAPPTAIGAARTPPEEALATRNVAFAPH